MKTTLTLELEMTDDALSGVAIDAAGARRPFHGWIGFVGAIDQLLASGPSAGANTESAKEEEDARN